MDPNYLYYVNNTLERLKEEKRRETEEKVKKLQEFIQQIHSKKNTCC